MTLLNHTVDELKRIKKHLFKSFDNDAGTLFDKSQEVHPNEGIFHFGVVREVMAYIELCSSIYCGWNGKDDGKIATSEKAITFIKEIMGKIDPNYKKNGRLFYCMYRHGSTHLLRPHRIKRKRSKFLFTWKWYSGGRESEVKTDAGILVQMRHLELYKTTSSKYELPVSSECLINDTLDAINELFNALIKVRNKRRLPIKQKRVLTFIAEGIVKRGDI